MLAWLMQAIEPEKNHDHQRYQLELDYAEKDLSISVDVVSRGRRIGDPGVTQALIELLVCEHRGHVCSGREAKEQP